MSAKVAEMIVGARNVIMIVEVAGVVIEGTTVVEIEIVAEVIVAKIEERIVVEIVVKSAETIVAEEIGGAVQLAAEAFKVSRDRMLVEIVLHILDIVSCGDHSQK